MKKSLMFFLILWASHICAVHSEEAFLQGNNYFKNQQYDDAIDRYSQVKNPGFAVLYNTALCYMLQKNSSQSLVYLLRAEKCADFKQLDVVYTTIDEIKGTSDAGWYDRLEIFFRKCILSVSMFLIQIILLLLIILFIFGWYRRWFVIKKYTLFLLFFAMLIVYKIWQYKMEAIKQEKGVVIKLADVKSGPDDTFYNKAKIEKNQIVTILKKNNDYYQIKQNKLVGWVKNSSIEQAD